MKEQLLTLAITLPPTLDADASTEIARMAGRLGFTGVHLPEGASATPAARLAEAARPAQVLPPLPAGACGVVRVNDPTQVAIVRRALDGSARTGPLLVAVPLSIGRTMSEAVARAELEPRFELRHPRDVGIFGTFEHAQEQVLALARAGAEGLVLDLPLSRDVADVLAQVKALVVGATPQLLTLPPQASVAPPRTVFYGTDFSIPPSGG